MNADLVILALLVGGANWVFRVLPMKMRLPGASGPGPLGRFLGATGPAAIATLFVASVLPEVQGAGVTAPLVAGVGAVVGVFTLTRSVALATVAGAVGYGAVFVLTAA